MFTQIYDGIQKVLDSELSSTEIGRETDTSRQVIDKYRKGISKVENMTLSNAEKIMNLKEKMDMKTQLTTQTLNAIYYDEANNWYELEFILDNDQKVFVRVNATGFEGANTDEFYWDEEKNVKRAVEEGDIQ